MPVFPIISSIKKKVDNAQPLSSNMVGSANVEGTRFENISNPYANLPRQQTGWDRLLNALGFRSGYDKAQEQYNLAGAEFNSQLEQLASEEKYNSPVEQARRMREAGLNPDLTGVSGEPASEMDNQVERPDVSTDSDFVQNVSQFRSAFGGLISNILGSFGSVASIAQSMTGALKTMQDYDSASIGQSNSIVDLVSNISGSLLMDPRFPGTDPEIFMKDYMDILQPLIPNSRIRKRVIGYLNDYAGSLQNVINDYQAKDKMEGLRSSYNTKRGDATYSEYDDIQQGLISRLSKGVYRAQEAFNKYQEDYFKRLSGSAKAGAENAQNGFASGYYGSLDSGALAGAENTEAEARKYEAQNRKEMFDAYLEVQRTYRDIMHWLARKADDGSLLAKITTAVIGAKMNGLNIDPLAGEKRFGKMALPFLMTATTGSPAPLIGAAAASSSFSEPWMPFGATNGVW